MGALLPDPTDHVMDEALKRATSADMLELIRLAARRGLLREELQVRYVIVRSDTGREWAGGAASSSSRKGSPWVIDGMRYKRHSDALKTMGDIGEAAALARARGSVYHRSWLPVDVTLRVARVYTITLRDG